MTNHINRISFIGAGSIAGSIIKALISKKMIDPKKILVTNRANEDRLAQLSRDYGIQSTRNTQQMIKDAELIVLAIKPQDAQSCLNQISQYVKENQTIVSVMAGITTSFIEDLIPTPCPVIRVMPNTSSEVGMSSTTLCAGKQATSSSVTIVQHLFQAIGTVTVVQEQDMDTTTAIAGSGPAYFYYIAEAIQQAAKSLDLDETTARNLIADSMIGAGVMMKQTSENLEDLRKNITSPGGTTVAGIKALKEAEVDLAFQQCIYKAADRSKQLQKYYSDKMTNQLD